jgi:DMSO/TMAO reductase YedYZ molybdopterin-dependent catalytic subunit
MSEGFISRGFRGRREVRELSGRLPPGPGFWESLGYHNHSDPWKEERYWGD